MTKIRYSNNPYWMPPVTSKAELTTPPEDYLYAFAADAFTDDVWVYKNEAWSHTPIPLREAYESLGYFEVDV